MPARAVTIACADPASDEAAAWRSRLLGAGPWEDRVELRGLGETGSGGEGAAVLVLASGAPRPGLLKLIDHLLGSHAPALVLAPDDAPLRAELEPQGVVVLDAGSEASAVAATLAALSVRQAAVEHLAMDLRIARASHGGLSGEMAKLHDELELAGKVQRRFLPDALPDLPAYSMGVLFRPCGYVSGDIYDVVALDEHRVAFVVADAVGHGVPAALLTLVIGKTLRASEPGSAGASVLEDPTLALARLNEELCRENETGDRFATAVCGVLDTRAHEITLASGGHPPALVIDRTGGVKPVEGGAGPLLGVFAGAEFESVRLTLGPGQTLLLYSDGFETAFPKPGEDPGASAASEEYVRHFAETVRNAHGNDGLQRALERLAASIDGQSGSLHQRDDLTALAIGRLARTVTGGARGEPARAAA